jgi:hypothetical protein
MTTTILPTTRTAAATTTPVSVILPAPSADLFYVDDQLGAADTVLAPASTPGSGVRLTLQAAADYLRATHVELSAIDSDEEVLRRELMCPDCGQLHTPMGKILASIADAPDFDTWCDDLDGVIWVDMGRACPS